MRASHSGAQVHTIIHFTCKLEHGTRDALCIVMRYIIEVMDERDKGSSEPWSAYGEYTDAQRFSYELEYLAKVYIREHPIVEFRVRIEK